MNRGIFVAGLLVRQQMIKEAGTADAVGKVVGGVGRALKGTGRVAQKGFSEAGEQAAQEIGGVGGKMVGGTLKATPAVAAGGAAVYGTNEAAGDPLGRYVTLKRQQLAQRVQGNPAYQHQGVYY